MKKRISVLIVEDDELHTELIQRAFEEHQSRFMLRFSSNLMEARIYMEERETRYRGLRLAASGWSGN